jgi:outer membrane lipoprotein
MEDRPMTASPRILARALFAAALALLLLPACASRSVIPEDLEPQIDWGLPFEYLLKNPAFYENKMVAFGGEVLSARRLENETRIEILQLPLYDNHEPQISRTLSLGRFLAYQKEFLDPATLPRGTRITVVGTVRGPETAPLDDAQYTFPVLDVRHLVIWTTRPGGGSPNPQFHIGIGGMFVR